MSSNKQASTKYIYETHDNSSVKNLLKKSNLYSDTVSSKMIYKGVADGKAKLWSLPVPIRYEASTPNETTAHINEAIGLLESETGQNLFELQASNPSPIEGLNIRTGSIGEEAKKTGCITLSDREDGNEIHGPIADNDGKISGKYFLNIGIEVCDYRTIADDPTQPIARQLSHFLGLANIQEFGPPGVTSKNLLSTLTELYGGSPSLGIPSGGYINPELPSINNSYNQDDSSSLPEEPTYSKPIKKPQKKTAETHKDETNLIVEDTTPPTKKRIDLDGYYLDQSIEH